MAQSGAGGSFNNPLKKFKYGARPPVLLLLLLLAWPTTMDANLLS